MDLLQNQEKNIQHRRIISLNSNQHRRENSLINTSNEFISKFPPIDAGKLSARNNNNNNSIWRRVLDTSTENVMNNQKENSLALKTLNK